MPPFVITPDSDYRTYGPNRDPDAFEPLFILMLANGVSAIAPMVRSVLSPLGLLLQGLPASAGCVLHCAKFVRFQN